MNELLSMISLCKKAGKLLIGFDVVKQSIIDQQAFAVFTTKDISPKTKKEIAFFCEKKNTTRLDLPVTMEDMEKYVRRKTGVISITDKGLAEKIIGIVNRQNGEVM